MKGNIDFAKYNTHKILEDCCICKEIHLKQLPDSYKHVYQISNRSCYETPEFIAMPSISPLAAGHLLIFPKQHISCLQQLSLGLNQHLVEIVDYLAKFTGVEFGTPFFFEHGVAKDEVGACGILETVMRSKAAFCIITSAQIRQIKQEAH